METFLIHLEELTWYSFGLGYLFVDDPQSQDGLVKKLGMIKSKMYDVIPVVRILVEASPLSSKHSQNSTVENLGASTMLAPLCFHNVHPFSTTQN